MNHELPAHARFRPGTTDRDIWEEALVGNVYRLPYLFAPGDAVLDVGAHTGAVAWRCAASGAWVVAVEPCRDNYRYLLTNLEPVQKLALPLNAACWRSDRPACLLDYQRNWTLMNTGGGCVMGDAGTPVAHQCLGLPLDDLLRLRESWRLLKIDCEGAEFAILGSSKELHRVREIAGEYHRRETALPFAAVPGLPCEIDALIAHLAGQGFAAVDVVEKGPGMGYFFARRG